MKQYIHPTTTQQEVEWILMTSIGNSGASQSDARVPRRQ